MKLNATKQLGLKNDIEAIAVSLVNTSLKNDLYGGDLYAVVDIMNVLVNDLNNSLVSRYKTASLLSEVIKPQIHFI